MNVNTPKIQKEMKRVGMTLSDLGDNLTPKTDRRGAWYLIHCAKTMRNIERIANALGIDDPKDLVI